MKPKSIRAAIQMMLPEVEEMLSLGVSREEVFKAVSERFGLENVNVRSFDTALYRARQNRAKHAAPDSVLHNTKSAGASEQQKKPVLHNTEKPAKSEQVKK
ncbi:plasmid stabilization protein StbA, partial [Klebsiella pneumoniae]